MISSKEIGEEIKRLRKKRLLSQKELADGICCQTTISSIESGRAYPSVDTLYYLSLRLNVTMDYFFQPSARLNEAYITETMSKIEHILIQKDYTELYEITNFERILRVKRNLGGKFNQFIDWHYYRAAQLRGLMSWRECVDQLYLLINSKEINRVQFQDLKIKNVIANILTENGQIAEALHNYQEILQADIPLETYQKFKLKVYFNLSKLLFIMEDYSQSVKIAKDGIALSKKLEDFSMLGNLYTQAAQSMIKIDSEAEEITLFLADAKFLFRLGKRHKSMEFIERLENNIKKPASLHKESQPMEMCLQMGI
ncbi:helix-turn-helix transcriptional regulator [Bacillus tianshenii]|uniref:helix-turn-helix domain-containing protein n=1 Tax=Sutcliffiella tianshenii TaxID=1463404 RepID=UPI001CD1E1D2|nr:helix-turn-helix domain-containing protein [Bacillus tianshenii]MCA1322357.1 helix-turn-helix transcriptional regulator [Bacillus tianshenii]